MDTLVQYLSEVFLNCLSYCRSTDPSSYSSTVFEFLSVIYGIEESEFRSFYIDEGSPVGNTVDGQ